MACLMPLHASAKRVGAFFNISTMGFPIFFLFCAGFLGKTPRHLPFCILYSPLTSPPPICSPLPGRPMRDGCPKGRTSRVPTLQQLGYLEAPILGGVFLGGGWGVLEGGNTQKKTHSSPFSLCLKKGRYILFCDAKQQKITGGRRRDTDYMIFDLEFCVFLTPWLFLSVERFLVSKFFNQQRQVA